MNSPLPSSELEYVGFWPRAFAALIDTIWVSILISLIWMIFPTASSTLEDQLLRDPASVSVAALSAELAGSGRDMALQGLAAAALIFGCWIFRNTTPGKMAVHARIVDAETGQAPSTRQLVIRYLGYYVSILTLFVGFLLVAIDPRRQGLHDKLAGTVVVRPKLRGAQAVSFSGRGKS